MTDRELMQQALEALEQYTNVVTSVNDPNSWVTVLDGGKPARDAITALRAAIEQANGERGATYSSKLQCVFNGWRVLSDGEIALDVPKHNCCDMRGAIDIASAIMPSVWKILTFCDGLPDVMYILIDGKWKAYDQRYRVKKTSKQYKNELREKNA